MKPTHLLAGLLTLAAILLDLVVLTRFDRGYATPLMLFLGLAFGQLALLSFWCAWGRRTWLPRLLVTLAIAALLSEPLGRMTAGQSSQWFLLFCLFVGCVAVATRVALEPSGMDQAETFSEEHRRRPPRRWTQCSLGGILSLMTVVGLGLGLSRHVALPREHALAVAIYGFWLVVVALTGLWALLSRRAISLRLLLLALLCIVAGLFMARAEHDQSDQFLHHLWFFTMIAFIEAIVICAVITVLQMAGCRVDRWSGASGVKECGSELFTWPPATHFQTGCSCQGEDSAERPVLCRGPGSADALPCPALERLLVSSGEKGAG